MNTVAPAHEGSPFRRRLELDVLNKLSQGNMIQALGIVFTELGEDFLRARMPVDARTRQPYGLLHGGASVVLAETLGSTAGMLCLEENQAVVGLEINANHMRGVRDGDVVGTARPVHLGRSTQVWQIDIQTPAGKRVCSSRLTLAVIARE